MKSIYERKYCANCGCEIAFVRRHHHSGQIKDRRWLHVDRIAGVRIIHKYCDKHYCAESRESK